MPRRTLRPNGRRAAPTRSQDSIFQADCDLSSYRFHLGLVSHAAVVGEQPAATLLQQLEAILSSGEPIALPGNVVRQFLERRTQQLGGVRGSSGAIA
ncbi:MAG TPA: hypothetical protein VGP33_14310 [Chloroflexota bacterium]|nr:hypothetical protein [Chloroflexota bacterium]